MAITTTPLGFQKPDGNEAVRNGDNVIAANAQKAEDRINEDRGRLGLIEQKNTAQDDRLDKVEAKNYTQDSRLATQDARLANLDNAAGFTGDPLALNDAAFAETLTNGTATSAALDVRLTARVPPIVSAAIASDPTIASSAATMAQNTAGLIPAWKASTAYAAGQRVIAPNGDVVSAKVNFTSSAAYSATNWNASTQDGRIAAVETKNTDQDARLNGRQPADQTDLHTITEQGDHRILWFTTNQAAQNMPVTTRGILNVLNVGTNRILTYKTYETNPRIFMQTLVSGVWGPWKNMEDAGVVAAAAVAARATDLESSRDGKLLADQTDFRSVAGGGKYKVLYFSTDYVGQHMPVPTRGVLDVSPLSSTNRILTYMTYEDTPRMFICACVQGVWGSWRELGPEALNGGKIMADPTPDFHTISEAGKHKMLAFPPNWADLNMPVGTRGILDVVTVSSTNRILTYTTYEAVPRVFIQACVSGVWGAWTEPAAGSGAGPVQSSAPTRPASGLKVVPLQLNLGNATQTDGALTGTFRYPMKWNAPLQRVRVNIQNVHPSSGTVRAGAVDFTGLWVGKHASNGAFAAAPTQVQGAFSSPADGSKWVSKWFWLNQTPGVEDLLSFGYTASNGTVFNINGAGWKSTDPAVAGQQSPTLTSEGMLPFYVWLEAETYATTPHLGVMGDSIASGVGAAHVQNSWLSKYCYTKGALPTHYSNSGDTLESWGTNLNHFKWNVFDGLAIPDAVIIAGGSNDLNGVRTNVEIQSYYNAVAAQFKAKGVPNLYAANILPRTSGESATFEVNRRAHNNWLTGLPGGVRDLFNFRDVVSSDDETLNPAYDYDGVHLNASGYAAIAASITRPVTAPPVMYQTV